MERELGFNPCGDLLLSLEGKGLKSLRESQHFRAKSIRLCVDEYPKSIRILRDFRVLTQTLKPSSYWSISARLKSCPDTKHFSKLARNRLTWTLVLQSSIKPSSTPPFTA